MQRLLERIQLLILFFVILITATSGYTQEEDGSLSNTLQELSADVAKRYVAPISSAFGSDLNAGWFHTVPEAKKFGFDLEFGLVGMGSFFPQEAKHFETSGQLRFSAQEAGLFADIALEDYTGLDKLILKSLLVQEITSQYAEVDVSGATIIGSEFDSLTIFFPGGEYTVGSETYTVPPQLIKLGIVGIGGMADINVLPLFAPQLSLGTIYGTRLTLRYIPDIQINEELGSFRYFGFGLQHNPGLWFKHPLPFDIAASFYTQNLKFGNLLNTSTVAFGVNASKQLGLAALNVTPYVGFMVESATMEVSYDYIVEVQPGQFEVEKVKFDIEGENNTRFTFGLSIRLLLINLNADYNVGQYNSVSVGLNFAI